MTIRRIRSAIAAIATPIAKVVRTFAWAILPETSEEAVVLVGLALLAGGFAAAGLAPLALLVPGALLVAIGLGFTLRRTT